MGKYKCLCCGYRTLDERGGYDICPICFWEDEPGQREDDLDKKSGANHGLTMRQAKENYKRFGACEESMIKNVRKPNEDEIMEKDRMDKQFKFCLEADKEKNIKRQTYLSDGVHKENDAEHAWHMSLMALVLSEYANEEIDLLKTISMILIHDIVEIDAGDTYAYDETAKQSQREREEKAADRIFDMLPADQKIKFRALWEEFEAAETKEAKFARAMDNLQPLMLNNATGGKSWEERGVRISQILKRNEITPKGSEELWEYAYENMIRPNVEKGKIIEDRKK